MRKGFPPTETPLKYSILLQNCFSSFFPKILKTYLLKSLLDSVKFTFLVYIFYFIVSIFQFQLLTPWVTCGGTLVGWLGEPLMGSKLYCELV